MSQEITLTDEQKELIERLGVKIERNGLLAPAPARIAALLMISPVTELTFDQIRETLNLSKSATSNAINTLLNGEKIEYITKPGDRKRYFKNKIASWKSELKKGFQNSLHMADLFEEILTHRPEETPEFNDNLRDIIDFMRFMEKELPLIYRKWEESRR